jgi:hypothetical protein
LEEWSKITGDILDVSDYHEYFPYQGDMIRAEAVKFRIYLGEIKWTNKKVEKTKNNA